MVRAWVDAVGQARLRPCVLHAHHPDGRRVLWPLMREGRIVRTLRPAGGGIFDYGTPVVLAGEGPARLGPAFWAGLEAELASRAGDWFDIAVLGNLRLTGDTPPPDKGWEPAGVAPFLRLDRHADFDAWLAARSKGFRKSLRRRWRLAESAGPVHVRVCGPADRAVALADVPRMVELMRARHGAALPTAPFHAFLGNLAGAPLAEGLVVWSRLTIDGRPASHEVDFQLDGVIHAYQGTFEPELAELSPGSLLQWRCIERAFAEGLACFDLLLGGEAYKAHWTDGDTARLVARRIASARVSSRMRQALHRIRRRLARRS